MFIYSVVNVNTADTDQDQEYELEVYEYDAATAETVADLLDNDEISSDTEYLARLARYYGLHT